MRFIATLLAAAVLVTAHAAAASPPRSSILGILWFGRSSAVAQLDRLTLAPLAQSPTVAGPAALVTRSPDGRRALFSVNEAGTRLRVLDLSTMTWGPEFGSSSTGAETALWTSADRLVVLAPFWTSLVDPLTGHEHVVHTFRYAVVTAVRTAHSIVALLAPPQTIGRVRLAVVDETARVRSIGLRGLTAGTKQLSSQPFRLRTRMPGLAVSPDGTQAVIVPASGPVVCVDLETMTATPHRLAARTFALHEKSIEGASRIATWFGPYVAVTGYTWNPKQPDRADPIGLTLVDTRDWSSRVVDPTVVGTVVAGDRLVAIREFVDGQQRLDGVEAIGYDTDLRQIFDVTVRGRAWVSGIAGSSLYIAQDNLARFEIVDTATGAILAPAVTPAFTTSIIGDS